MKQAPDDAGKKRNSLGKIANDSAHVAAALAAALHSGEASAKDPQPRIPQASSWSASVKTDNSWEAQAKMLPTYMRTYGDSDAPDDFPNFCFRFPDECTKMANHTEGQRMQRKEGDDFDRLELADVHNEVLRTVRQVTDKKLYGVNEKWMVAGKAGDCEDIALRTRKELIKKGWEPKDLLMTVVQKPEGDWHAVLTARTVRGDLILDVIHTKIDLWSVFATKHGYRFWSRQSYLDPNIWVSVNPENVRNK